MPPTDPNRPKRGGQEFDEDFWEDLADYLVEPRRKRPADAAAARDAPPPEEPASEAPPPVDVRGEPEPTTADDAIPRIPDGERAGLSDASPGEARPDVSDDLDDGWWEDLWDEPTPVTSPPSGRHPEFEESAVEEASAPAAAGEADHETAAVAGEGDVEPPVDGGSVDGGEVAAAGVAGDEEPGGPVGDGETAAAGLEEDEEPAEDGDLEEATRPIPADDAAGEDDGLSEGADIGDAEEAASDGETVSREDWPRFEPAPPPAAGDRRAVRRRLSARTQRRVAVGLVAAAVVAVVGFVVPVRNAVATAARGVGSGTADVTGAVADRWRSWSNELQTIAAGLPARQIDEQRQIEGSESLLFVVEDAGQRTVAVAVLSLAPDGASTLVLLPPSLYEILPGYGDFPLADATVFEGADLTAVTVANVLGIRIDDVATLGPGDLTAALAAPIQVDLPTALVVDEGGGTQRVLAQAGPGERSADQAEALMVVRGTSDPLEWLQRQTTVWDGVLTAVGTDPGVSTRLASFAGDPTGATGTLARAAAGDPEVTVVPVTRVSVAGAEEGFKVSYDDAEDFVARRMPHLLLRQGERPRVEVLNGNGRVLTTRSVSAALIRRGFRVVKTDNAENFDFETTLVIAQGRDHRADADEAIGALGTGELLLELRAPSGVVDVSIIVGHDIPAGED